MFAGSDFNLFHLVHKVVSISPDAHSDCLEADKKPLKQVYKLLWIDMELLSFNCESKTATGRPVINTEARWCLSMLLRVDVGSGTSLNLAELPAMMSFFDRFWALVAFI